MPDKTLDILIRTRVDNSGAKAAVNSLDDVLQKTKAGIQPTQEAAAAAQKFELSHRELAFAIRAALPGVGEFAHIFSHLASPAGPILLAAAGIGFLISKFVEFNRSLDEAAEKAADPSFLEAIKARQEVVEKYATEAALLADHLNHLVTAEEHLQRLTKAGNELLQTRFEATKLLAEATQKLALAQIAANPNLTDDQKKAAAIGLETSGLATQSAAQRQFENQQLGQKFTDAANHQIAAPGLASAAASAGAAAKAAALQVKGDEDRLAELEKRRADLKKQADSASQAFDAEYEADQRRRKAYGYTEPNEFLERLRANAALAGSAYNQNESNIHKYTGRLPGERTAAALAGEAQKRADEALLENSKKLDELTFEIKGLQQTLALKQSASDAAAMLAIATKSVGLPGDFEFSKAAALSNRKEHGGALFADDQKFLEDYEANAKAHGISLQSILNSFRVFTGTMTSFAQKMAEHDKVLLQLQQQIRSNNNGGTNH